MKYLFLAVCLALTSTGANAAWTTDYSAALAQAKTDHKLVLLDFTGSDWCGYCKLLDKEVLDQQAFNDYAEKNYVLVTLDYPHQKELPPETKKQNEDLAQKFGINGFPTLIVVDPDGKELGRQEGYNPGSGTDAVVAKLKSFQK